MPKKYISVYMRKVNEYLSWLESMNRSPVTIEDYQFTLVQFYKFLKETERMNTIPHMIGIEELEAFRKKREREVGQKYYQTQMRQLRGFFMYIKNDSMSKMHLEFSAPPRPYANWLSPEEAKRLLGAVETPSEDMVIHLALELGLRMIEIRRLRVQDFDDVTQTINVLGKGRNGGKWRTLPYHKETKRILHAWLTERNRFVAQIVQRNPQISVPDALIIREWSDGTVTSYDKASLYRMLKNAARRGRITPGCGYHTLRRTLGRTMYNNGVRIEKIAHIFGHSNPETTLLYIGINLDDMAQALDEGARFR